MGKPTNGFSISADTQVGRQWVQSAMRVHNELISNCKALVDSKQSTFSKQYSKWLKQEARWKPGWEERRRKHHSDKILKDQVKKIKNSKGGAGTTDCYPSKKAMQYRKWRSRNPSYLPGWSESMWIKTQLDRHDDVIKKANPCVDTKLDAKHSIFKEWREKHPPLPPIDEPTPSQYRRAKYGTSMSPTKRPSDRESISPSIEFGDWPEPAESSIFSSPEPHISPVVDEGLVRHVFEMSMNNTTNPNVARLLQERTMAKFPNIFAGASTVPGPRPQSQS